MSDEDKMVAAWQRAGRDLGIEIIAPHIVGGQTFPVYIPSFGRASGALPILLRVSGTLPFLLWDQPERHAAESADFFISYLNPEVYCEYDRATFIETLMDWGWFGALEQAPDWYRSELARLLGERDAQ